MGNCQSLLMKFSVPQASVLGSKYYVQCTQGQLVLSARITAHRTTLSTDNFIFHSCPRIMLLTQVHSVVWRAT